MKRAGPDQAAVTMLARRVFDNIDWRALGDVYFHEGGEALLHERRPRVLELGEALGRRLGALVKRNGSSLWVGAGITELPVLLAEVLLHGRTVTAANLRAPECELLNAALAAAAPDVAVRFECGDARELAPGRAFDHIGCISVFTDPETWPLLSDVAYGRIAPVQIDVERFVAERHEARAVASGLFARLTRPGVVTTTAEEVSWWLEVATANGCTIDASDDLVETAMVGDPVGFLTVAAATA